MKNNSATASLLYIHILMQSLIRHGIDPDDFMQKYGFEYKKLTLEDGRISIKDLHDVWDKAIKETQNLTLGLDCGMNVHPSDYGIMSHVWMNCENLNEAFQLVVEYKELMSENFECDLLDHDNETSLYSLTTRVHPQTVPSANTVEFDFASILHMGKFLAGNQNVVFDKIHFTHKALADSAIYEQCFGCEVYFEKDENRIFCPKSTLKLPVRSPNHGLKDSMLKIVNKLVFEELGDSPPILSTKVTHYLKEQLGKGFPEADTAAEELGFSLSTFKRHLQKEGTSYQELVTKLRKSISKQMLMQPETSICDITFFLGFSNVSAFHRAFKRWFDMTPKQFRQNNAVKKS